PAVQKVRDAAARTQTGNNLKQCALATHAAHDVNGCYPPYFGPYGQLVSNACFFIHLLPFVEQQALYSSVVNQTNGTFTSGAAAITPGNASAVTIGPYQAPPDWTSQAGGAAGTSIGVNVRLWFTPGATFTGGTLSAAGTTMFKVKMP